MKNAWLKDGSSLGVWLGLGLSCWLAGCATDQPLWDLSGRTGGELPIIPTGVESRSVTEENPQALPGAGGTAASPLGPGRKGAPCRRDLQSGQTAVLMDYAGCGVIRHIWITLSDRSPVALRNMILRMYWDGSEVPSVEVPIGDFFGTAHGRAVELNSSWVSVPRGAGFNCYFPMPFSSRARITLTNDMPDDRKMSMIFYQIDFDRWPSLPPNTGRFHAQFRRENPTVLTRDYVVLDGAEGPGMYVGTVIGVRPLSGDWWGEGEMKFYIDDDTTHPTICGTGTEDYFGAAWGMALYQTLYLGCTLLLSAQDFPPHGLVSMYRWHERDPVYFRKKLRVEIQQIGWGKEMYERSDDWCSVAYWYQLKPLSVARPFPDRAARTAGITGS